MTLLHTIESKTRHGELGKYERKTCYTPVKERAFTGLARNPSAWEAEAGQLLEFEVSLDLHKESGSAGPTTE